MGNPARRIPRSTARAISLWLAKRILPLLAYRTITRAVMGSTRAGFGVAGPGRPRAGHQPPPDPAPVPPPGPAVTTVSGRSFAPVGPAWISVPMAGQTPQS